MSQSLANIVVHRVFNLDGCFGSFEFRPFRADDIFPPVTQAFSLGYNIEGFQPYGPDDNPSAAELLARIRAEREAAANAPGKKSITRRNPVPGLKARHVKAQAEGLGKNAKKTRSLERAKPE